MPKARKAKASSITLEPGKFYKSRDGYTWCCFKVNPKEPEHAQAFCIRTDDNRIEYFYLDGRYDHRGAREHTLVELCA